MDNKLFAKREKCAFDLPQLDYLGYRISTESIQMDPAKKLLLSLTVFCTIFSLCYGSCGRQLLHPKIVNGKKVMECTDFSDRSVHPVGSTWNSENCMQCSCGWKEMVCCSRYGGISVMQGCITKEDPETCTYKYYRIDDPSVPC
ncbi:small serum protein 5-like isoform X2 [Python bivittatus]|uniref:Small serum protein 5-like isoform X2 n=1 Tax=Python bivittatus TaxID=176946 RepID=A0A9F5N791_PYTBI|nr:small serum protein 5-like isoform X2 [Python bivittatus]